MLSRENEFVRLRDGFSILLSQLRSSTTARQLRRILRTQQLADNWYFLRETEPEWFSQWILEVSVSLASAERGLNAGRWRRDEISRLEHLYRHLLD